MGCLAPASICCKTARRVCALESSSCTCFLGRINNCIQSVNHRLSLMIKRNSCHISISFLYDIITSCTSQASSKCIVRPRSYNVCVYMYVVSNRSMFILCRALSHCQRVTRLFFCIIVAVKYSCTYNIVVI